MEKMIVNMLKLRLNDKDINNILNTIKEDKTNEEIKSEAKIDNLKDQFDNLLLEYDFNYTNSKEKKTKLDLYNSTNEEDFYINLVFNNKKDTINESFNLRTTNNFLVNKNVIDHKHNFNFVMEENGFNTKCNINLNKNISHDKVLNNKNIINMIGELYENQDSDSFAKLKNILYGKTSGVIEDKILI